MSYKLIIDEKAFSINGMYYNNSSYGKTAEATKWSHKIFNSLSLEENQKEINRLREDFDPKTQNLSISILCIYPKNKLITKNGYVSARSIDISNFEKPLIDLIMLPRHRRKSSPFGCNNIGHDDVFICSMHSYKRHWTRDYHRFVIKFTIKNNQSLGLSL